MCDGLILLQFLSVFGRQSWETREGNTGPVQSEEAGWKHELSVNTQFALITAIRAKHLEARRFGRSDPKNRLADSAVKFVQENKREGETKRGVAPHLTTLAGAKTPKLTDYLT